MNFESEYKELRQYDIAKMQCAIARERKRLEKPILLLDYAINALVVMQSKIRRRSAR